MRLYIAGPMTGLPDHNYPAFFAAEQVLVDANYDVENPARNELDPNRKTEPMWRAFMRMSLVQISRVDGLALLPGWQESKGARIEAQLAEDLGLVLWGVDEWVRAADKTGATR